MLPTLPDAMGEYHDNDYRVRHNLSDGYCAGFGYRISIFPAFERERAVFCKSIAEKTPQLSLVETESNRLLEECTTADIALVNHVIGYTLDIYVRSSETVTILLLMGLLPAEQDLTPLRPGESYEG